jgi:hypothetical protein
MKFCKYVEYVDGNPEATNHAINVAAYVKVHFYVYLPDFLHLAKVI